MHEDIRNSQQGDEQAYRRLVERHQPYVGKLLWRFTRDRNEHEELTQQTFVEAYLGLKGFRGEAPFSHWLARIATRVGYRYWSQQRRRQTVTLDDRQWQQLGQADSAETDANEAGELVHWLLGHLSPPDRLVLTLRYLDQSDVAETAYRTGWTQARVRVQTHRAMAKLKQLTAERGMELDL